MFSDAFPHKVVMGCLYEVEGKYVNESSEVGVVSNDEEGTEDAPAVINLVAVHNLCATVLSKRDYQAWLKVYTKKLLDHLKANEPDRVPSFQKESSAAIKAILSNFKDYDFYTGGSMDPGGQTVLMSHGEDGMSPAFLFWKDGLIEEKQEV